MEVIREADANADIVLACVHWGTEYSTVLEEVQMTTGKLYLDAGADAIIGSHSHCLQAWNFIMGNRLFIVWETFGLIKEYWIPCC